MTGIAEHSHRRNRHRQPRFAPVPESTAAVLDQVDDQTHPSVDYEWETFKAAIADAVEPTGRVSQNRMRARISGAIAPRRVGPFYRRACRERILRATDEWEISDDTGGRNSGRPVRVYELDVRRWSE